jgi:transposase InsO family protein
MRQPGLWGRAKGRFRVHTTDRHHDQPIAPNRLAERPAPSAPNQIRVADITYLPTQEGWL